MEAADLGISVELILCVLRDFSAESALDTLTAALAYRDKFIGVGLDSDERENLPAKFAAVFARARDNGLKLTRHCDIDQVGSIENIRQALNDSNVALLNLGVLVTVNSDDPAYFGAYVADNYLALVEKAELSADELVLLAKNSLTAFWLSVAVKQTYLDCIDFSVASHPTT